MIVEKERLSEQVSNLLAAYPELEQIEGNSTCVRFQGSIFVNRIHNGYTVRKKFSVQLVIPLNNDELPYAIDVENQVEYTYSHRYTNGRLCLATDSDIRLRFLDGFDMVAWVEEFVEIYYYSYEYYQRFKEFPFGERRHGYVGVIESYQDRLRTANGSVTLDMMRTIATQPYRGHHPCPCGSGRKVRNCHGEVMLWFYSDVRRVGILQDDLARCAFEMERDIKRGKYQAKTK